MSGGGSSGTTPSLLPRCRSLPEPLPAVPCLRARLLPAAGRGSAATSPLGAARGDGGGGGGGGDPRPLAPRHPPWPCGCPARWRRLCWGWPACCCSSTCWPAATPPPARRRPPPAPPPAASRASAGAHRGGAGPGEPAPGKAPGAAPLRANTTGVVGGGGSEPV